MRTDSKKIPPFLPCRNRNNEIDNWHGFCYTDNSFILNLLKGSQEMSDNLDIILRGRKIKRISDIAFGELRKKYGIKQLEVEILIYLSRNPESSASSFIKEMGLNKGQVSVAMDNLSSGGFITLKRDNKDHRYSHASITEKTLPVLEEAEKIKVLYEKMIFSGISPEDAFSFWNVSKKMMANLEKIDLGQ